MKKGFISIALTVVIAIVGGYFAGYSYQSFKDIERDVKRIEREIKGLDGLNELGGWNPVGGLTYRLQSSIGTTNTSIKLSSFKNRSDIALTMTNLDTDIGYGTLSPQTTRSEFVSFTGVTQNSDGTAILTGVIRGLADISPFTASTTMREAHPGQSVFILSDSPQLFEEYASRRSDDTIVGRWNYSTELPFSSITATTSSQFVNKGLLDATANQGAATSTRTNGGILEIATRAEAASTTPLIAAKPLTLISDMASSTPMTFTGSGNTYLTMSEDDGYLSQLWLDLTEAFSFTGGVTMNNSTTTNATTTTLHITNNPTVGSDFANLALTASSTTWTSSGTYAKSAGVKIVEVYVIGAGGGGGGGRNEDGSNGDGGGGGAGGGYSFKRFRADALGATETVTVGTGGAGGAGASSGNGTIGSVGGDSSFGTSVLLKANGGSAGTAGVDGGGATSNGGAQGNGEVSQAGGNGGAGENLGTVPVSTATDVSPRGGGGGGDQVDVGVAGAGFTTNYVKAGGAGGADETDGTDGSATSADLLYGGVGGGGGGEHSEGGDGGTPGGGGGGGGGDGDAGGSSAGTGGAGADGLVIVIEYF